jgi:type 1 glutamine amidotransferase
MTMLSRFILTSLSVLIIAMPLSAADKPVRVLIITGDHGHAWKETTPYLKEVLTKAGITADVTETPSKDLTADNLGKYDVLLLNYKDTKKGTAESTWSDTNKKAFTDAVKGGKGLLVYHHASSAFVSGDDFSKEFEKIIAGGWRKQGNHGKRHEFSLTVRKEHPITKDLPKDLPHSNDELYANSVMLPEAETLVTAFSDKKIDPKNTDKHEPVVWIASYGKGRVVENVLGHDVDAMKGSAAFRALLVRCVEWAATGDVKSAVPSDVKGK